MLRAVAKIRYGKNIRCRGEVERKLGKQFGFRLGKFVNDRLRKLYFIL